MKKSTGKEEDLEDLPELDKKLKQLRSHICNNHYVNLEELEEEEYMINPYLGPKSNVQTRSSTRKTDRQTGNYSTKFGIFHLLFYFYKILMNAINPYLLLKIIILK